MTLREAISAVMREHKRHDLEEGEHGFITTVRIWRELVGVDKPGCMTSNKWARTTLTSDNYWTMPDEVKAFSRTCMADYFAQDFEKALRDGEYRVECPRRGLREARREWRKTFRPHALAKTGPKSDVFRLVRLAILEQPAGTILWSEPADWVKAEAKA